jgi:hypothetical protein
MRRRKIQLPLSTDSLLAAMLPDQHYTTSKLACMIDGSPAAIADVLATLVATGRVCTALAECGRYRDSRESRRLYWLNPYGAPGIALRRVRPAEVVGQLTGYDLMSFARRALAARR